MAQRPYAYYALPEDKRSVVQKVRDWFQSWSFKEDATWNSED